jgi:hypothetical protein
VETENLPKTIDEKQNQTTEEKEKLVNEVSVKKLFRTVRAIQANPDIADFNFRAKDKWINGGYNKTNINEFYAAYQTNTIRQPFIPFDWSGP